MCSFMQLASHCSVIPTRAWLQVIQAKVLIFNRFPKWDAPGAPGSHFGSANAHFHSTEEAAPLEHFTLDRLDMPPCPFTSPERRQN
jgi:hypothetical protein